MSAPVFFAQPEHYHRLWDLKDSILSSLEYAFPEHIFSEFESLVSQAIRETYEICMDKEAANDATN